MTLFDKYISDVEQALRLGNATEHTHRPAFKAMLETIDGKIRATNEPTRIECGAPDFVVTTGDFAVGYIETKDVGRSLSEIERSDQIKRYRSSLSNLIVSDYLDFRWYVDGELVQSARLAEQRPNGTLRLAKDGEQRVHALLQSFFARPAVRISSSRELAERMAKLTHIVRDIIVTAFEKEIASDWVKGWRRAFSDVLIADLDQTKNTPQFADMFAQTLAYGIFTARVMADPTTVFTREEAQRLIPRSNPFLRNFFIDISNPRLDDEPFACFVNDLVALLANTDMASVLANFGRRTKQQDPVVHFYETFLAAYDPKLRETRGVYYTPEPVVSYIVRSVDAVLKGAFGCPAGLADQSMVTIKNRDTSLRVKGKDSDVRKTTQSHKVIVLDPATGTGTFLYAVIDLVRQQFVDSGNAGLWPGYVHQHLLPRLFGFELMVAPFAVAHFKLSLQLAGRDLGEDIRDQWAVQHEGTERLGVYLTNTLDEAHEHTAMPLFTQWVAQESIAADTIKMHSPVLVVMGNPPYSGHSENHGQWIDDLLHGVAKDQLVSSYYHVDGQPLGERNPKWLQDDYVKFLCFGQSRIARSGQGILAYITNHGFLDNPTFRGMRQSLMNTFTEVYVLDLHGNVKKRARNPSGDIDQNVFDIQQGVSISIFIKQPDKSGPAKVFHADLWGRRTEKYQCLLENDKETTKWEAISPQSPFYLFKPLDTTSLAKYEKAWKVTDIFPVQVLGFQTHRDAFAVGFDESDMEARFQSLRSDAEDDDAFRARFKLKDNRDWNLADSRKAIRANEHWKDALTRCLYRPFDWRTCYFSEIAMDYPRREIQDHFFNRSNLCLLTSRQQADVGFTHVLVSVDPAESCAVSNKTKEQNYVFPLFTYPNKVASKTLWAAQEEWPADERNGDRRPNVNPEFVSALAAATGLNFDSLGHDGGEAAFTPFTVFDYIYGMLHSSGYRDAYGHFLRLDFPRIPLPSSAEEFANLAVLGRKLRSCHLLGSAATIPATVKFPIAGSNLVERGYPEYASDGNGRVNISPTQYFDGVSAEEWAFEIGSYQVLEKWLRERQKRQLSYDELTQYQRIIGAVRETISIVRQIDELIEI